MDFSIKELTALAKYDYIASPFPDFSGDQLNDLKKRVNTYAGLDIFKVNEAQALGKPYFMSLTLQREKAEIVNGENKPGKLVTLPNEPLITISLQKTIVETATVGEERRGTVKEYVCTEDYVIDINGVCVGANGDYPAEEVKMLNELFNVNEALNVHKNLFFELFGITKIVLKSIKFDEMMGKQSLQKYSINAISDMPFFAELKDRAKFLQK